MNNTGRVTRNTLNAILNYRRLFLFSGDGFLIEEPLQGMFAQALGELGIAVFSGTVAVSVTIFPLLLVKSTGKTIVD